MTKIWIVDDDNSILEKLEKILGKEGYDIRSFIRPDELIAELKNDQPALVVADLFYKNSELSGEDVVKEVVENCPPTQVVIISGETDFRKTLQSLRSGALDFIEKPLSLPRLLTTIKNGITIYHTQCEMLRNSTILGESAKTKAIIQKIRKLATLNEPVLICGESGVGKELAAQNLHLFSPRFSLPMKEINCTAFNNNLIESELFGHKKGSFTGAVNDKKGIFELSQKSSLFIDEIGDLPFDIQSKLLRVLQEKKLTPVGGSEDITIDSRLIFATHRDLNSMIEKGEFREDLYFRISTFAIELPPLRERIEDIDQLAPHFLTRFLLDNNLPAKEFSSSAIAQLKEHLYPGNIRELIQVIKNAAFFSTSDTISAEDINFSPRNGRDELWQQVNSMKLSEAKAYFEKEFLQRRLKQHGNHVESCANSLGIIRNNLYRKLRDHNIEI